ncbi:hypothetical protein [Bremerella alba]|uniref:Uncharacterized protein n=1 Tax=Bremerella alba TaxID=980252 RepID=A0A7V8V5Z2_9BACT|nr:hypothetical protein [Bremerella alba]MBA2115602.1 hypothetical protein [Bremerella alba]
MPALTPLGAIKILSNKLQVQEFPECEDARALEAFLYLCARIKGLRSDAERQASYQEESLNQCRHEFEFIELVLVRLRTFLDLTRPLEPMEIVSAMSTLQFLARRLTVPYDDWDLDQRDSPDLAELCVELE